MIIIYTVYVHTNLFNNKKYVGITSKDDLNQRFLNGFGYKNNKAFWEDIQKYGWDSGFKHETLFKNLSMEDACKKEIEYINKFNTTNNKFGYNRSNGGDLNPAYRVNFFRVNIYNWEDYRYYTNIYNASIELDLPVHYIAEKLSNSDTIDDLLDISNENKKDIYFFIKKSDAKYLFKYLSNEKKWEWDKTSKNEPKKIDKETFLLQMLYYSLENISNLFKTPIKYSDNHIRITRINKDITNLKQLNTEDLFFFFDKIKRFKNNKNFIFYEKLISKKPKYYQDRFKENNNVKYPEIFKAKRTKEKIRIEKVYNDIIKKYGKCEGIDLDNYIIDFNKYNDYIDSIEFCEG